MNLSVLNVDTLLYLTKFMSPESRFNAFLSGVLPGLEHVYRMKSLSSFRRTILTSFKIHFGPSDYSGQIEIRSLDAIDSNVKWFIQQLMENGFLKNVRRLRLAALWRQTSSIELNGAMNHLEDLSINSAAAEDLIRVFTSCPKLTRLSINLSLGDDVREDELRPGFQRLKFLELGECTLSSFLTIMTFCDECIELRLKYTGGFNFDRTWNMELVERVSSAGRKVHTLGLSGFSDWLPKILPCYANIRELDVELCRQPNDSIRAISHLTNLRRLCVTFTETNHLKEIVSKCPQLEILEMTIKYSRLYEETFADVFGQDTNIQELKITCEANVPIEQVLPVFKRWHQLRRLYLKIRSNMEHTRLPVDQTIDFINKMTHLTHLHLDDVFDRKDTQSLRAKINEEIVPARPGFVLQLGSWPWLK